MNLRSQRSTLALSRSRVCPWAASGPQSPIYIYIYFFFYADWEILVPHAGVELVPPALKVWNLNCWTTSKVPVTYF